MTARDIIAMHDSLKTRMPLTLSIPRLAPSLNRSLRMHWSARKREQAAWDALVLQALNGSRPKMERARVEITRFYAKHPLDKDGLYGAHKPVVDALVHAGIIPDDSPEHIELTVKQVKVRTVKNQRTEVTVTAMDPNPTGPESRLVTELSRRVGR